MRLGGYIVEGPAASRRVLQAVWLDWIAGAFLALLAFPFPLVRQAAPVPVFVLAIVSAVFVGAFLYLALTAKLLGRTPGMYLLDLGFVGDAPGWTPVLLWAFMWAWVAPPALVARGLADGDAGPAARVSGLRVGAVAGPAEVPADGP